MDNLSALTLDELDLESLARPAPKVLSKSTETKAKPPQGFRFWYDSLCDSIFDNPGWSIKDHAEALGRSYSWLYVMMKSDSFRLHFEQRRQELNDHIQLSITKKASEAAVTALDMLCKEMVDNPAKFTPTLQLEVIEKTTKVLGMGVQKSGPAVVVNQQTNVVPSASASELQRARELIKAAEQARLAQPLAPKLEASAEGGIVAPAFELELEANAPDT
jgi:hypothetical protein